MSSGGSEMRGFVFSVIFILIFGALLSSVPAGLQGSGEEADTIIPIDPSLIAGFDETKDYDPTDYSFLHTGRYYYDYDDFGGRNWRTVTDDDTFLTLAMKVYFGPFWFGSLDYCEFESPSGQNRGTELDFDEIDADAEDYAVRYSLTFEDSGDSAGSLVVYWNGTASVDDAWDNDDVYLRHGVGFDSTATTNIAILLVSLLFLQLPEVPTLINILLAAPIWACIIFVLWYVIKEMIPFV
jgi:hypothetical protein